LEPDGTVISPEINKSTLQARDRRYNLLMSAAIPFDADEFLAGLTHRPGVYRMLDDTGKVLYVGKARNLKSRVTSYFRSGSHTAKTMALVGRIARIEVTVTGSETEALLLEQSLIKLERPAYNVMLRDDKSYPFIYLTDHSDFPRLAFHRGARKKTGKYFGPYPSASAVRESLNILQKLFRIRQCDDNFMKNRSRPCLQYQIQRCSGPCVNLVDEQSYADDVRFAIMFLEGRSQAVLDDYKGLMDAAAGAQQYEKAARYRDQIMRLRKVQEQQYVYAAEGDVDVFAYAQQQGVVCVQGMFIRQGRVLGSRTWFPRNELGLESGELLEAFLDQFYLGGSGRDIPRDVITAVPLPDSDLLETALSEGASRKVKIASDVRGQRARWLDMATENATYNLSVYLADKRNVLARFLALAESLSMDAVPERLECFDISHTMGEGTVASCVVFDHQGPAKSDYRRFNIEGVNPGDDYGAMEQALRRRYTRLKSGEGIFPDLLVIDGGVGQLGRARQVLAELQVDDVPLLGIAKGPTRKPGLERYFFEDQEVVLKPGSEAVLLLQHIRDEAHRFAITGHRARRQKARRVNELDQIDGVGPKRRKALLMHFGSIAGIKGASREEIARVPGINEKLAADIHAALHGESSD